MRSKLVIAAAMLLVAGLVPGAARAAASDLDRSFAAGGLRFVDNVFPGLGEDGTGMSGMRRLSDGRLVVLGTQRECMGCFSQVVARYTPAGDPDVTFGNPSAPGAVRYLGLDDYGDGSMGTGLAVRRDGGLVLGYDGGPLGPRLVSVPADGISPLTVTPISAPMRPEAILPDGRVLALSGDRVVLLRTDLTPDPALGGGAGVAIPHSVGTVVGLAATGNAVLVAGADRTGLTLWRVPLRGGSAVLSRVPFPRPPTGGPLALRAGRGQVLVGADGRALVAVRVVSRAPDESLVRRTVLGAFDRTGRVDRPFGVGGALLVSSEDTRIAVQSNGKVVVVSSPFVLTAGARTRLLVRRFDAAGRPDPSFRPRRVATVAQTFYGFDVVVDGRGRIVIAGAAFTTFGHSGVLFVRLQGGEAPPRR
jgi:hypothetical protein